MHAHAHLEDRLKFLRNSAAAELIYPLACARNKQSVIAGGGPPTTESIPVSERNLERVKFDALPSTLDDIFQQGRPMGGFHHRKPSES